jgi:DNA-binding Lrp family transcriptional regulator
MLDEMDTRLLAELQCDALITAEVLGARLNLSASQAGRRRQRLEAEGYITGYAARLDAGRLGLGVQAFIQVQMATHGKEPAAAFARMIAGRAEVVSAWTLTGEADYLLRVYCADLPALGV